jgi:hypothetical protein
MRLSIIVSALAVGINVSSAVADELVYVPNSTKWAGRTHINVLAA